MPSPQSVLHCDGWLPSLAYLQPGDLARGNAGAERPWTQSLDHCWELPDAPPRQTQEVNGQKQVVLSPSDRGWKFRLPNNQTEGPGPSTLWMRGRPIVDGETPETIAKTFGTTVAAVKGRLRYGLIHPDIRAQICSYAPRSKIGPPAGPRFAKELLIL